MELSDIKKYFKLQELVCSHVYNKFGNQAWQFLNSKLLETLYILRTDIIGSPMTINTWFEGGSYSQRGLRCNLCSIPKGKTNSGIPYMSAHCTGNGIDFVAKDISANECRKLIKSNSYKLPYNIRLEEDIDWVHFDLYDTGNKIYVFKG